MVVNETTQQVCRRAAAAIFLVLFTLVGARSAAGAQSPNPTSAANPFFGSVTAQPLSDETLKLSLDEAIARGLRNNLGLKKPRARNWLSTGKKTRRFRSFCPGISLTGDTGVYQHNLAALGFGPGLISKFSVLFPGGVIPPGLKIITKDDLTEGQIHFSETLFSGPVIAGFKAANAGDKAAHFAKMSARGQVCSRWPRLISTRLRPRARWITPLRWSPRTRFCSITPIRSTWPGLRRTWMSSGQ